MIDAHYPTLSRIIVNSLLWRTAGTLAAIGGASWRSSATATAVRALAPLRATRTLALIAAGALAIAVAAQLSFPHYVRSGLPVAWPLIPVVVLIAIAVWPLTFERAWPQSILARWLR